MPDSNYISLQSPFTYLRLKSLTEESDELSLILEMVEKFDKLNRKHNPFTKYHRLTQIAEDGTHLLFIEKSQCPKSQNIHLRFAKELMAKEVKQQVLKLDLTHQPRLLKQIAFFFKREDLRATKLLIINNRKLVGVLEENKISVNELNYKMETLTKRGIV